MPSPALHQTKRETPRNYLEHPDLQQRTEIARKAYDLVIIEALLDGCRR